jgi:hypothetical protein
MSDSTRAAVIATAAALGLLAAGCGTSASGGPSSGGSVQGQALAYADCLHAHGVPNWPDPTSSGAFDKSKLTLQQLGVSGARLQAAQTACRHLLPAGAQPPSQARQQEISAKALSFARCVRAHGVAGFPDPDSTGRIPDPASVGIDQGSPRFQAANQACRRYRPPYMPSNAAYTSWARTHGGS